MSLEKYIGLIGGGKSNNQLHVGTDLRPDLIQDLVCATTLKL